MIVTSGGEKLRADSSDYSLHVAGPQLWPRRCSTEYGLIRRSSLWQIHSVSRANDLTTRAGKKYLLFQHQADSQEENEGLAAAFRHCCVLQCPSVPEEPENSSAVFQLRRFDSIFSIT